MPIAGISQGLGIGGGTSATPSGAPAAPAGGFNIGTGETASTIEARTGDPVGFITWATDTFDVYVSDGNDNWAVFEDVAF